MCIQAPRLSLLTVYEARIPGSTPLLSVPPYTSASQGYDIILRHVVFDSSVLFLSLCIEVFRKYRSYFDSSQLTTTNPNTDNFPSDGVATSITDGSTHTCSYDLHSNVKAFETTHSKTYFNSINTMPIQYYRYTCSFASHMSWALY